MAEASNIVRVPKPSRASFNMNRPLAKNSLLMNQVKHLHELEKQMPPEKQSHMDYQTVTTEGKAAEYIRKMTEILHVQPK